jgi:hypothetical protein
MGRTATCKRCGEIGSWRQNRRGGWYLLHSCLSRGEASTGGNERHSSLSDYSHWNEEASIVKAQEDRWTDYYSD